MSVFFGDGAGNFGSATSISFGFEALTVAVADSSGDGKPDVAVTGHRTGTVAILFGNGSGGFAAPTYFAPPLPAIPRFKLQPATLTVIANWISPRSTPRFSSQLRVIRVSNYRQKTCGQCRTPSFARSYLPYRKVYRQVCVR